MRCSRSHFAFITVEFELLIVEGQQLRYCGYGAKHDDIFIKGDPNELKVFDYPLDLISAHVVIFESSSRTTSKPARS